MCAGKIASVFESISPRKYTAGQVVAIKKCESLEAFFFNKQKDDGFFKEGEHSFYV